MKESVRLFHNKHTDVHIIESPLHGSSIMPIGYSSWYYPYRCRHRPWDSDCHNCRYPLLRIWLYKLHVHTNGLDAIFHRAITATRVNKIALLGGCADASHVGRIGGRAAAGLGLVIDEDKQIVGPGLELFAHEVLIGLRIAPCTHIIARTHANFIERTDGLIFLACGRRI